MDESGLVWEERKGKIASHTEELLLSTFNAWEYNVLCKKRDFSSY